MVNNLFKSSMFKKTSTKKTSPLTSFEKLQGKAFTGVKSRVQKVGLIQPTKQKYTKPSFSKYSISGNKLLSKMQQSQSVLQKQKTSIADYEKQIKNKESALEKLYLNKVSDFGYMQGISKPAKDISPDSLLGLYQVFDEETQTIKTYKPKIRSNILQPTVSGTAKYQKTPEVVGQNFDFNFYKNNPDYTIERNEKGKVTRIFKTPETYKLYEYERKGPDEKRYSTYSDEEIFVENGKVSKWIKDKEVYLKRQTSKSETNKVAPVNVVEYDKNGLISKEYIYDIDERKRKTDEEKPFLKTFNEYQNGVLIKTRKNYYSFGDKTYDRIYDYVSGKEYFNPVGGSTKTYDYKKLDLSKSIDTKQLLKPGITLTSSYKPAETEDEIMYVASQEITQPTGYRYEDGKIVYDVETVKIGESPDYETPELISEEKILEDPDIQETIETLKPLYEEKYKTELELESEQEKIKDIESEQEKREMLYESIKSPKQMILERFDKSRSSVKPIEFKQDGGISTEQFTKKSSLEEFKKVPVTQKKYVPPKTAKGLSKEDFVKKRVTK